MAQHKVPPAMLTLLTVAMLGASGCGDRATPTASLPPAGAPTSSVTAGSAIDPTINCGPMKPDLVQCLQVVAVAADGLSNDNPRDQIRTVQVFDGGAFRWCLEEGCIDAPAESAWVQFNWDGATWERVPLYVDPFDPESRWQAGFPVDLLPGASSSMMPS